MTRRTHKTKRTQKGSQRQNTSVPATPVNNHTIAVDNATDELDHGDLTPQELDFRNRGIGGEIKFKRRNGHHCLMRDCAESHKFSTRCITQEHDGWCPGCKHLVHGRYGCEKCYIKRADLFFDTNNFTRWLMIKESREVVAATQNNNQGNANAKKGRK